MSDDLPVRRRRRPAANPVAPDHPASPSTEVLSPEEAERERRLQAKAAESPGAVHVGQRFERPEQAFPTWHEILAAVQAEFVARSKGPGGIAAAREEEAYYNLVNSVVSGNPSFKVAPADLPRLVQMLRAHQFGYGLLERYMAIPDLEEVYFNRYDQGFYIALGGAKHRISEEIFKSNDDMLAFLERVANENGLEINLQHPILDAALSDGSRLNATIEPIAVNGPDIIIRKHRNIPFTIETLIEQGYLTPELASDLQRWIAGGMNIVVSGGTGSGKTSFLNAVGKAYIPRSDRVLVLKNRKELQIETDDCKYFQTREDPTNPGPNDITLAVLVRAMLRKRPRRIIVGEVRGAEHWALSAWNTGHEGSFCTIHANSGPAAISRLEQLASSANQLRGPALQGLIADAVDIIVQVELDQETGRRRVREVIEVLHPHKYPHLDTGVVEQVRKLSEEEKIRVMHGDVWVLPLYQRDRDGRLARIADGVPLSGRGEV